ncbi:MULTISPECIES: hypothetical protein [Thiothrix]|uniref:PIN-like domain-containing protein n=1 Tax=Thiothrix TaxID=1030 RepID=UPI00257A805B|nr:MULTISPECIES: hypothetical protein [Thiothrix]MDX9987377.1 hypothetical protein [Thiothrix unzii]
MKLFLDNNLPPSLATALNAIIAPLQHQAVHLSEKFPRNIPDLEWISALGREGGWVILSNDRFREYAAERKALADSGLVVFWLSGKQWGKLKILEKNLSILEWTRAILEHAEPASVESKQTGKGSIWAMRHIPNRRKYEFEREKLT